jgi:murein L,D-transpeptidase YcbB/YkuD
VLEGPVIVGRPDWETPQIDSVIDRLEFNPYWTVPPRIAAREVWPKAHRDPAYLKRNHMRLVNGQIRQDPGPDNPLGKVKFLFPNPYSVYLHDTNRPELFTNAERFRSHGCIRVSGALDLARALLRDDPSWPEARIENAIGQTRNIKISPKRPIPVHIVYDTAWVDKAGRVQFRDDVYGRDLIAKDQNLPSTNNPGAD